ncbi:MAG: alpha/beta hydrolase [Betaproteobacteria bacterium]|nr:alpha/beta hydrolase [Betaproteobacteria bacterium]
MNFIVQGYPAYAYTGGRPFDPNLPAIVFIHGAALDHSVWHYQARYLAHHGFASLAVDLPGHGRSPGTMRNSIEAMGDWVAAFIEAACTERAHVVGHSMGSLVALDTALRHGGRVAKLALLGAGVPMPVGDAFLAAAREDSPAAFDMQTAWGHARQAALATSAIPGLTLPGASRQLVARAHPGVQHADLAACHGYAPSIEAIRALNVSTLVIAGRRDTMTPLKAGQALAKGIPGAKLLALDTGHAMTSEAPREVTAALRSHLREAGAA